MRTELLAVAWLLLGPAVAAQQHRPCFVRVVAAGGRVVAGAAVTCGRLPNQPGGSEVLRGTTDERGRCRFDLPPGVPYTIWAIGPAGSNGHCLVSTLDDRAAAGRTIELELLWSSGPRRLRVLGAEPWAATGPLHVRVFPDARQDDSVSLPLQDGFAELPPLPVGVVGIGLADAAGVIAAQRLSGHDLEPTVEFAAPQVVDVRVVDAQHQPVADVAITHQAFHVVAVYYANTETPAFPWPEAWPSPRWHLVGRTDAEGRASLRVPPGARSPDGPCAILRASKSGWRDCIRVNGGELVLQRAAAEPPPIAKALANTPCRAAVNTVVELGNGSACLLDWHGGESAAQAFPAQSIRHWQLTVDLLPTAAGAETPGRLFLPPRASPAAKPELALAKLHRFDLEVVDAASSPVPDAEVGISWWNARDEYPIWCGAVAPDGVGRATFWLDDGTWVVYARAGNQRAVAILRAEQPTSSLRLQLEPLPTMRCRIVDAAGKPVRGAIAEFWGGGIAGAARTEDERILEGVDRLVRGHALHGLRSDRDGMLALPLLPRLGFEMKVRIRAGPAVSEKFDLRVDTEPTDVVVR